MTNKELASLFKEQKVSTAAQLILNSLLNYPENWKKDKYHITHKQTGLAFWISNGRKYFRIEEAPEKLQYAFTETELDLLWRAYELIPESYQNSQKVQKEFAVNWAKRAEENITIKLVDPGEKKY